MFKCKKLILLIMTVLLCAAMTFATGCEGGIFSDIMSIIGLKASDHSEVISENDSTSFEDSEEISENDSTSFEDSEETSENDDSYTITLVKDNGEENAIIKGETYGTLASILYADDQIPSKPGYAFIGWYIDDYKLKETDFIKGNVTVTAKYVIRSYTIQFLNFDGTVLQSSEESYNAIPTYKGETPTKAADAQYSYEFKGWNKEIAAVTDDVTYIATYTATLNTYTVTFQDEDGSVLQTAKVAYGTLPEYTATIPTKEADAQHSYVFNGWDKEIVAVSGDVVYTATYKALILSLNSIPTCALQVSAKATGVATSYWFVEYTANSLRATVYVEDGTIYDTAGNIYDNDNVELCLAKVSNAKGYTADAIAVAVDAAGSVYACKLEDYSEITGITARVEKFSLSNGETVDGWKAVIDVPYTATILDSAEDNNALICVSMCNADSRLARQVEFCTSFEDIKVDPASVRTWLWVSANDTYERNPKYYTEIDGITIDGEVKAGEAYGANELNVAGEKAFTNVKGTVIGGDLYFALTITHEAWSTPVFSGDEYWKNDLFEFQIGSKNFAVLFLEGELCLPEYVTEGAAKTVTDSNGKQVTTLEIYVDGADGATYNNVRINANGNGFGWNDVMWNNSATVNANGIVENAISVGEISLDGSLTDSVYTSAVKANAISTDANGATLTLIGAKTAGGVIIGATVVHTKPITELVGPDGRWSDYMGIELRLNGQSDVYLIMTAVRGRLNCQGYSKTVDNGNGTYTTTFEIYVYNALINATATTTEVNLRVGGFYETGFIWFFGSDGSTDTHKISANGIVAL